jgi:hypothetical protein
VTWLGPFALCAVGIGIAVYGLYRRELLSDAMAWPVTAGVISDSRIEEYQSHDRQDDVPMRMYRPVVAFDYVVGGREFRSRRFPHADVSVSVRAGAEALLEGYPKGKAVQVHVDPADHTQAVIDPALGRRWSYAWIAFGAVLAVSGVAWYWTRVA